MRKLHLLFILWLLIQNIKKKSWRNLPEYIPSLLYVSFFSLLYNILCKDYLMWDFKSNIKHLSTKVLRSLHIFIINPLLILSYLSTIPDSIWNKILYTGKWIVSSTLVEWLGQRIFKVIFFDNGWHLGWSTLIYVKMYFLSYFMTKKPLLTWMLSFLSTIFFLIRFKVPVIHNLKEYKKEWNKIRTRKQIVLAPYLTILTVLLFLIMGLSAIQRKHSH